MQALSANEGPTNENVQQQQQQQVQHNENAEEDQKVHSLRFTRELEFVSCLTNPFYLHCNSIVLKFSILSWWSLSN